MAAEVNGSVSAAEYRSAQRRNRARTDRQRARGDHFGQPPYGYRRAERSDTKTEPIHFERIPGHPLEKVLATVKHNHGNILRSVRDLNAAGTPSPRGGNWGTSTLTAVVKREAPELRPRGERRGRPTSRPRYFTRLLRCHCGRLLSPSGAAKADHWTCRTGHTDPRHPKPYNVSERVILEWAKAEAARLRPISEVDMGSHDLTAERHALEARRERLRTQHLLEVITDDELAVDWADIRAALDALDAREGIDITSVPDAVDWGMWPTDKVNAVLRSMWWYIELGHDLRPIRAEWRVPEWRAA